jgi:hypothetical protein
MELAGHHFYIVGMAMPYTNDSMTTVHVQVFLILIVPDLTAFALYDINIEE